MNLPIPDTARLLRTAVIVGLASAHPACAQEDPRTEPLPGTVFLLDDDLANARREMVERYIAPAIEDSAVVAAMRKVPRHRFIPRELWSRAYHSRPRPIGGGQTISQPIIVAMMTELLELGPESKVLEIGTGSGYQAAVLAEGAGEIYSIEILPGVAEQGAANLEAAGYDGIHLRVGDGYLGWPDEAPFDGIIVTCAPDHIPDPLQEQLVEGGRLVIPVGERGAQELIVAGKEKGEIVQRAVIPVRFVPMTGAAEKRSEGRPSRLRVFARPSYPVRSAPRCDPGVFVSSITLFLI
jgi:protein-L-isoaspartate(D-aspartate) O-methyltransferase